MSRTTRYNASAAALRTRSTESPSRVSEDLGAPSALPSSSSEYVSLSVWQICPAPWQPRRVFQHLEELAATIAGDSETEGVGVLEPVLVRRVADGKYELIDGERRLRAGQLIAQRSASGDFQLPARVFDVSERVARLMGQTANLERDEPKPYEVALGYHSIREALRDEGGEDAASARALAGLGRHKKTQISEYLAIADALTHEVLEGAGLMDQTGTTDFAALGRMTKKDLHNVAKLRNEGSAACASALKARVERLRGMVPTRASASGVAPARTPEERRTQITTEAGFTLKVRSPVQMLDPANARVLLETELTPAMLAIVERAHGGPPREGFYVTASTTHTLLVVPAEIETLSAAQLERLSLAIATIRSCVQRATRQRRRNASRAMPE